ncbi:MAG: tyrosine-type recombinase/integrase [Nitrospiraceae bacterium]
MNPKFEIVETLPAALEMVVRQPTDFASLWTAAESTAEEWMRRQWQKLALAWLDAKFAKCQSGHTRRNYQRALDRWLDWVAVQVQESGVALQPWLVETRHVREYQRYLREDGALKDNSINHQMSCCSSFYSFVINEKFMVNGVEMCLFVDAEGRPRMNPFKAGNIARSKVEEYERANPLSVAEYDRLLSSMESRKTTFTGSRNYALVLCYLHTGWRSEELLRMQWKHIRPSKLVAGEQVFQWSGKGGKKKDDVLPGDCFAAILNYLKLSGRHVDDMQPDDYVWLPLLTHGLENLTNVDPAEQVGKHLSGKSALRILRTELRRAGIANPATYRVHDLRHTHAHLLLEAGERLNVVQERLNHSSLATTGIYVKKAHKTDPTDTYTQGFRKLRQNSQMRLDL